MLYSQSVKNIVAGISQQPSILRLPEQLDVQINGFSTEVGGLQKRPPTLLTKTLYQDTGTPKNSLIHWVNRDVTERYSMHFTGSGIRVFTLDGTEKQVIIPDNLKPYITTVNPRKDLRVVTIADYTFILNRTISTAMDSTKKSEALLPGGIVCVKNGQYGRTYKVLIDGVSVGSTKTGDGNQPTDVQTIDTSTIAQKLLESMNANTTFTTKYTATRSENWIHIVPKTGVTMGKLTSVDGFAGTALIAFTDHIQRFNLLPATCVDGYIVKILGDPSGGKLGSYWVKYDAEGRVWKEVVAPDILTSYTADTMPHQLVRQADGTFLLSTVDWDSRAAGDEDTNPEPSFVGQKMNDMFFHRNRLGFLAGESIILSENGNFFNFWMTTANDVLDTDPIDLPTTTSRINILLYAIPWDKQLYVFSDSTQFILSSDSVLTPKNTVLVEVTGFASHPDCRPVVAGKNIYFAAERAEYTTIKEYYNVQQVSDVLNAQDITSHVPSYIPNGVHTIIPNTAENLMLFQTAGDDNSLYIYKYLFVNENRVQSSWSKWEFTGSIIGAEFFGSELHLITLHANDRVTMERVLFTYNTKDFDDEPYRIFLDRKNKVKSMTYDDVKEITDIDVKAEFEITGGVITAAQVYLVADDGTRYMTTLAELNANNGHWYIPANITTQTCYIGIPYNFEAKLSTIYIKKQDQQGGYKALTNGRLQVRAVKINYDDTGYFKVNVETASGNKREYIMSSRVLGTVSATLGIEPNGTGQFRVPIQQLNTGAAITIQSAEPLPLSLIGFEWEGNFVPRSKGV